MKFFDEPELEEINAALNFETLESRVTGAIDLYTTKSTSSDRKLFRVLDKQYAPSVTSQSLISPPHPVLLSPPQSFDKSYERYGSLSSSPFGPLNESTPRKTFAYLVCILNLSDPDHDYSTLQPDDFRREKDSQSVISSFNNVLLGLGMPVPQRLWDVLDLHMDLKDCSIYSFQPRQEYLDDDPGTLWSMTWFFFNKRRKRVASVNLKNQRNQISPLLTSKHTPIGSDGEEYDLKYDDSYEEGVVGDMELDLD